MNDWISVKDRVPEPLEDVLTCCMDETIHMNWMDHEGVFMYGDGHGGVTHWMPLPAPPKMKEEL